MYFPEIEREGGKERERVKSWVFVTFNVITITSFLKISLKFLKLKIFSVNINYFHRFFGFLDIYLLPRN